MPTGNFNTGNLVLAGGPLPLAVLGTAGREERERGGGALAAGGRPGVVAHMAWGGRSTGAAGGARAVQGVVGGGAARVGGSCAGGL